jgi:hypothetical protein
MPRKVIERGEQANQARDAAMAAAGMEVEESSALDFYLDRLKTDITESPGRALDVATNFVAAVPGLLGDAQRVFNPKTGAPEGVRKLPTSSDIAEDMGASGEGYGAILGQLLSPLSPADVKLALGAGGALLGYMKMAGQGKRLPRALEAMRGGPAYHGTPHKFDQFDLEKIGTGEGNQAYGHGLYFAENPGVARSYATNLAGGKTLPRRWTGTGFSKVSDKHGLSNQQATDLFDMAEASIDDLGDGVFDTAKKGTPFADALDEISMNRAVRGEPHLYEVDIPDETIAKMLDWDAPLSEQPENVRRLVDDLGINVRRQLAESEGIAVFDIPKDDPRISKALNEAGIPGIRYYDANSRLSARPFRQVKRSFLDALPEDADFDEVVELVGTGHFTKAQDEVIKALEADDWLGFDYPSQAINASYADNVRNWEPSDRLLKALDESAGGADRTRNIVVFNPDDIKSVKRDGELVYEAAKPTTSGVTPGFTRQKTEMPTLDNMLENPDYFREQKGLEFDIVEMTPTEYFEKIGREKTNNSIEWPTVEKYTEKMRNGEEFPMGTIELHGGRISQEGQHRALAAERAFGKDTKMPVMVIKRTQEEMDLARKAYKEKEKEIIKWLEEQNPKPTTSGPK